MRAVRALLVAAALLGAALSGAGCSERARSNPFDPANPTTGGMPAGLLALAQNGLVTLRWSPASAPGLLGYQVFRSLAPASGYAAISSVLAPTTAEFIDRGLLNGTDHYYRLYFVFDTGLGAQFASDVATPGPLTPWVIEDNTSAPALDRLSADGRHIAERIRGAVTYSATDVDVDRTTGAVWTCDRYSGVTIYQPATATLTHAVGSLSDPVAVAVDPVDHTAWVGDNGFGQVAHFAVDGSVANPPVILPFEGPIGIAIDPNDESVWICERNGSRVRHARRDGVPLATAFVVNPSRVAVDSVSGEAWVTSVSTSRILRLSPTGQRSDSVSSIAGPLGIVVDGLRGRIWVTAPQAGLVVALSRAGATEFVVHGLAGASDVALDHTTGEVWVSVETAGAVVRIAPDGRILRWTGGFETPNGIALDPGTGAGPRPAVPTRRSGTGRRSRN